MSEVIERVKILKERAQARTAVADRRKSKTGKKDYSESKAILQEAIDLLRPELERAERSGAPKPELGADSPSDLAAELADCYGMLGGVYRREENLSAAIEEYGKGSHYERHEAYKIQNSYNITNEIALSIVQKPQNLKAMKGPIQKAIKFIEKQVAGERRDQWWAWADLGELYLLDGRTREAAAAFEDFERKGARARNYDSLVRVLDELQKAIRASNSAIAENIAKTIESLEKKRPSR